MKRLIVFVIHMYKTGGEISGKAENDYREDLE
jgi:hypothetical protein